MLNFCLEDGDKMKSLLMIEEYQHGDHKKFFIEVIPHHLVMNTDRASRLYRELAEHGTNVSSRTLVSGPNIVVMILKYSIQYLKTLVRLDIL